jgi:hypothetical protein
VSYSARLEHLLKTEIPYPAMPVTLVRCSCRYHSDSMHGEYLCFDGVLRLDVSQTTDFGKSHDQIRPRIYTF